MMGAWNERVDGAAAAQLAHTVGRWRPEMLETSVVVHDIDLMQRRLTQLHQAFPANSLHAVAIKANPVVGVLRRIVEMGVGLEAASFEEVELARAAGCPNDRIVYDSPAKTDDELVSTLRAGCTVNVDTVEELDRALSLAAEPAGRIGVRVNPRVGQGSIAATSVGGAASRFGISVGQFEREVIPRMRHRREIQGVHVHIGSQGCSLEQLVEATRIAADLRERADRILGRDAVRFVDIGGGLPTDYGDNADAPTIDDYSAALRAATPDLVDGSIQLITEFGRAIQAGCGTALTRVCGVKHEPDVAVVQLGADFMLRAAYQPASWVHRFTLLDAEGSVRAGRRRPWTVAGPLCFAGDVIGHQIEMPAVHYGDIVAIHDVGAYTLSMWSRHCSRGVPAVVGVRGHQDPAPEVLLPAESSSDVVRFWGGDRASPGAQP